MIVDEYLLAELYRIRSWIDNYVITGDPNMTKNATGAVTDREILLRITALLSSALDMGYIFIGKESICELADAAILDYKDLRNNGKGVCGRQ